MHSMGSIARQIKAVLCLGRLGMGIANISLLESRMRWVEIIEIRSLSNEKALLEPDLEQGTTIHYG